MKIDIKKIRKELDLNQTEFAKSIGVSRVTVGQIERGEREISKATKVLLDKFIKDKNVSNSNAVNEEQAPYTNKNSVIVDDAISEITHKIMTVESMLRIVLTSQAEILAQQRGESVSKVLSELSKAVNDETSISFSELQRKSSS